MILLAFRTVNLQKNPWTFIIINASTQLSIFPLSKFFISPTRSYETYQRVSITMPIDFSMSQIISWWTNEISNGYFQEFHFNYLILINFIVTRPLELQTKSDETTRIRYNYYLCNNSNNSGMRVWVLVFHWSTAILFYTNLLLEEHANEQSS